MDNADKYCSICGSNDNEIVQRCAPSFSMCVQCEEYSFKMHNPKLTSVESRDVKKDLPSGNTPGGE